MVSLFRHYVPLLTVLQLALEAALFFIALSIGVTVQRHLVGVEVASTVLPALSFAVLMVGAIAAFGLYRRDQALAFPNGVGRFVIALSTGLLLAFVFFPLVAGGPDYRDALGFAVPIAVVGVLVLRMAFANRAATSLFRYRILVLGTGEDALAVDQALSGARASDLAVVGFYALGTTDATVVPRHRIVPSGASVDEVVHRLGVQEVIVAVREQRGGVLPLQELLSCRLRGVRVTDLCGFFERVHGQVPVELLKASWLIYAEGFRQDLARNFVKRTFDIVASVSLLVATAPVIALTAFLIYREGGAPVIFRQERVGRGGRNFTLLKFRSMRPDAELDGQPRWAQIDDPRVTTLGRVIRRARIDELPQLWNVLKGEMSFVGPRPERPCFVQELAGQVPFYAARHSVKPGITGWAQVRFPYGASVEDATKKLRYDLYYVKNHSLFLDLLILLETVRVVLFGEGAR